MDPRCRPAGAIGQPLLRGEHGRGRSGRRYRPCQFRDREPQQSAAYLLLPPPAFGSRLSCPAPVFPQPPAVRAEHATGARGKESGRTIDRPATFPLAGDARLRAILAELTCYSSPELPQVPCGLRSSSVLVTQKHAKLNQAQNRLESGQTGQKPDKLIPIHSLINIASKE